MSIRLQEHRQNVTLWEIEKSTMADRVWREKRDHCPIWEEVEIIDSEQQSKISKSKELAHIIGYKIF